MVVNLVLIAAEHLRWSGGDNPWVEVSCVKGHIDTPTIVELKETPPTDTVPNTIPGLPGMQCYWNAGRGFLVQLSTNIDGPDAAKTRIRFRLFNRLRFSKHLVGEIQIAVEALHDGTLDLQLTKVKENRKVECGLLRVQIDRNGTGVRSRQTSAASPPQTIHSPAAQAFATLVQMFPQLDHGIIQDVMASFNGDLDAAIAALLPMAESFSPQAPAAAASSSSSSSIKRSPSTTTTTSSSSSKHLASPSPSAPRPPQPKGHNAQDRLEFMYANINNEVIKEVLEVNGGDAYKASATLQLVLELKGRFPESDDMSILATLDACRYNINDAVETLNAATVLKQKTDAVLRNFPNHDRELVLDVLEAVDYEVGEAALMLSSPEYAPKPPLQTLKEQFPSFDDVVLEDVLAQCHHNVREAAAMIQALTRDQTVRHLDSFQIPSVDNSPLFVGKSFRDVSDISARRCLIFLDDSGSMIGSNLRRGHYIISSVAAALASIPTKVVIFGSKNRVRIASDWDESTNFDGILKQWQGQSGRTYLWSCVSQFVRNEQPEKLHVLLITDGEDTESPPPFRGMRGMIPTVKRLNEYNFDGEISLVALGNEISDDIGRQYMALVGATGGAGAVINASSQDSEDKWIQRFFQTVTVQGPRAHSQREDRLRDYAEEVRKGKQQLVPAKALVMVDKGLVVDFDKSDVSKLLKTPNKGPIDLQQQRKQKEEEERQRKQEEEEERQGKLRQEEEERQRKLRQEEEARIEAKKQEILRKEQELQQQKMRQLAQQQAEQERLQAEKKKQEEERARWLEEEKRRQKEELEKRRREEEARYAEEQRRRKEEMERLRREREQEMKMAQLKAEEEKVRQLMLQQERERKQLEEMMAREAQAQLQRKREEEERMRQMEEKFKEEQRRLEAARKAEEEKALEEKKRAQAEMLELQRKMQETERARLEQLAMAEKKKKMEEEEERRRRMAAEAEKQERLKQQQQQQQQQQQLKLGERGRSNSKFHETDDVNEDFTALHLKHAEHQARDIHGNLLDADLQDAFERDRLEAIEEAERERRARVESQLQAAKEAALSPELRRLLERRRRMA